MLYAGSAASLAERVGDEKRWIAGHGPDEQWEVTVVHMLKIFNATVQWVTTTDHADSRSGRPTSGSRGDDATVLATSAGCPRQIVAYSRYVYGFQCHMEFTPLLIEDLIKHSEQELATLTGHPNVQQPEALRANDYTAMNDRLTTFLDRLAADYAAR